MRSTRGTCGATLTKTAVVKMAEHNTDSPASGSSTSSSSTPEEESFISNFISEIVKSPINLLLVAVIAFLVYKIFRSKTKDEPPAPEYKALPRIRRDFTVEDLKKYDGKGPDGRILIAVNGSVYDVTRGKRFYGPDGPYAAFGGRDASRGLATFSVVPGKDDYDDLSDLNTTEMNSILEWEEQFKERYDYVGKLLKPGEAPTNYSDEEDESIQQELDAKSKDD